MILLPQGLVIPVSVGLDVGETGSLENVPVIDPGGVRIDSPGVPEFMNKKVT